MRTPQLIALLFMLTASLALLPRSTSAQDTPDEDSTDAEQNLTQEAPPYVWWEGEDVLDSNFPSRCAFSIDTFTDEAREKLSGENWLANAGRRTGEAAFAKYQFEAPLTDTYRVWTRKFWKHGPFKWRIDRNDWIEIGSDVGLEDSTPLRQHVVANWVYLGELELKQGKHSFELELLAGVGDQLTACFDAFCLIAGDFAPRGKLKPDQLDGRSGEDYWPFEPAIDTFSPAGFNLSDLNEAVAGEHGFITRKDGKLLRGDGIEQRFWGVNCGAGILELSPPSQHYLAQRLAKLGVNMVRLHLPLFDSGNRDLKLIDVKRLDRLHYFSNLLAQQGIYTNLSFYFPLWLNMSDAHGFKGYSANQTKHPFALLFFHEEFQEVYREWLQALLETKNPYTGYPLVKDPAVAMIELLNEDSYFFWTSNANTIPPAQLEMLEEQYGEYLDDEYGSVQKALDAWGWDKQERDDPRKKRAQILDAWHMTREGATQSDAKRKRIKDQIAFLESSQRGFYQDTIDWLRKRVKVKSLISCGNWHTADARTLQPIEFHTYTPGDLIDSHGYFGGRHSGDASNYAIAPGQSFESRSAMGELHRSPVFTVQVDEMPRMVSEIGWPNPNRFRAEWPFIAATYGSLHGVDAFCHFAITTAHWDTAPSKFALCDPVLLGQFPALALAYRMGYLEEADPVVQETLVLDELFNAEGSSVAAAQNLDAFRADGAGDAADSGEIDPRAFLIGPVVQSFGKKRELELDRLDRSIDERKHTVASATKEIVWRSLDDCVIVDSDRFQGACGFLERAEEIACKNMELLCASPYASISLVSLDPNEAIAHAGKLLLQMSTESQHFGWEATSDGLIEELGGYPFGVRKLEASVKLTLAGKDDYRLIVLDGNGNPQRELDPEAWSARGGKLEITLPENAIYLLIERVGRE